MNLTTRQSGACINEVGKSIIEFSMVLPRPTSLQQYFIILQNFLLITSSHQLTTAQFKPFFFPSTFHAPRGKDRPLAEKNRPLSPSCSFLQVHFRSLSFPFPSDNSIGLNTYLPSFCHEVANSLLSFGYVRLICLVGLHQRHPFAPSCFSLDSASAFSCYASSQWPRPLWPLMWTMLSNVDKRS